MPGFHAKFTAAYIVFLICLLITVGPAYGKQKHQKHKPEQKKAAPAAVPAPSVPAGPLTPFNLNQLPSNPPQVEFHDKRLTIVAQNSTLGDILRAVRNQTGAAVDVPANATERVVGRFGPGPAREVIVSLLDGANFNYIVLGSAADPLAVERVIVTTKPSGPVPTGSSGNASSYSPPTPYIPPTPETLAEDSSDDSRDSAVGAGSQPEEPAAQPGAEQQGNIQMNNGEPNGSSPPGNGQPVIRTPEQLLQELQRQQQMQQQQQQSGGTPNTGTAQPQE